MRIHTVQHIAFAIVMPSDPSIEPRMMSFDFFAMCSHSSNDISSIAARFTWDLSQLIKCAGAPLCPHLSFVFV